MRWKAEEDEEENEVKGHEGSEHAHLQQQQAEEGGAYVLTETSATHAAATTRSHGDGSSKEGGSESDGDRGGADRTARS